MTIIQVLDEYANEPGEFVQVRKEWLKIAAAMIRDTTVLSKQGVLVPAAQAPQAAEPVANVVRGKDAFFIEWTEHGAKLPMGEHKLYAAPQAPAAQPLTEKQLKHLLPSANYIADGYGYTGMQVWAYGKLIERAHGIGIAPPAQGEQHE